MPLLRDAGYEQRCGAWPGYGSSRLTWCFIGTAFGIPMAEAYSPRLTIDLRQVFVFYFYKRGQEGA